MSRKPTDWKQHASDMTRYSNLHELRMPELGGDAPVLVGSWARYLVDRLKSDQLIAGTNFVSASSVTKPKDS